MVSNCFELGNDGTLFVHLVWNVGESCDRDLSGGSVGEEADVGLQTCSFHEAEKLLAVLVVVK